MMKKLQMLFPHFKKKIKCEKTLPIILLNWPYLYHLLFGLFLGKGISLVIFNWKKYIPCWIYNNNEG